LAEPAPAPAATTTSSAQGRYVRPPDLAGVLELLAVHPDARLVAGSTDWGVELNIGHARAALTIGIDRLEELREFAVGPDRIDLGAALSLSEIEARLAGRVPLLADLFPQFASRLIRNGATLGGNLGTASPIGDAPPALLALDASLVLASAEGEREVLLADYFTGYRQSVRRPDELIKTIRLPLPLAPVTAFHKIAKRRFDDISSVAVAYALTLDGGDAGAGGAGGSRVASVRIGLGGVAATPLRALAAEEALKGHPWTRETVAAVADELARAGTPMSDHRASESYRIAMLRNSLLKFYAEHPGPDGGRAS
ncbi:MAG TPA: FAD binding domain-containing protein, partial [Streptosporangiaceae bacterium]|nr:FAD binding domain-containing protein [Streptosporangiaceae bacterium]